MSNIKACQISQSSVLPLQKSSSKTCQKNDSPSCRNILFQGELYRNVILSGQEISEFSDDDFAEVDVRKQSCYCKNGHSSRECLRNGKMKVFVYMLFYCCCIFIFKFSDCVVGLSCVLFFHFGLHILVLFYKSET